MYKHFLSLAFLLVSIQPILAQGWIRDSLEKLRSTPLNEFQKVDLLLAEVRLKSFEGTYEEALTVVDSALEIAQNIGFREGEARAYVYKYNQIIELEGPDKALPLLEKAIALNQAIGSVSIEAFIQYHLAEYYHHDKSNLDQALTILEDFLPNLDDRVHPKDRGNFYKEYGLCLLDLGRFDEGIAVFKKALQSYYEMRETSFIDPTLQGPSADATDGGLLNEGQVLIYMGEVFLEKGNPDTARAYTQKAIEIYEQTQMPSFVAWCYENLYEIADFEGDYKACIEHLTQALTIYQEQGERRNESYVLQQFGWLYLELGDYEQSILNYQKSNANCQAVGDTICLLKNYIQMAELSFVQQEADLAMQFLQKAKDFTLAIHDDIDLPDIYYSISRGWNIKNEPDSAIHYAQVGRSILQDQNRFPGLFSSNLNLANIYYQDQQLDSALYYAQYAKEHLLQFSNLDGRKDLHQLLRKIYEERGDYQKALVHYDTFFVYHDSLYQQEVQQIAKTERIRQNVNDYIAEKDQANLKAQLLSTQKNLYLTLAIGLLILLLVGTYLFYQIRLTKKALEDKNRQLANLNATKDKFFSIIAHDIRSPITALDSVGEQMEYYLSKNDVNKLQLLSSRVEQTAKKLSTLLDNLLNWALVQTEAMSYRPRAIFLQPISRNILELYEPFASTKGIRLENHISVGEMAYADENALSTILRNLINNALKFTPRNGIISISTFENEYTISVEVKDNGVGIKPELVPHIFSLSHTTTDGTAGEKGAGLGLILCRELVELNKGSIKVISQLGKGTSFIFTTPKVAQNML